MLKQSDKLNIEKQLKKRLHRKVLVIKRSGQRENGGRALEKFEGKSCEGCSKEAVWTKMNLFQQEY